MAGRTASRMGTQVTVVTRTAVGTISAETGRMKIGLTSVVAFTLLGCAADGDIEDPIDDVFMTEDAKADAFGVEDWSPDGAAVLRLVSTASQTKLHDDVGLSTRVAKAIVTKRGQLGGEYEDLADLDAAPYVGKTVFNQLLRYVAGKKLFKTALRIPLVVDDGYGNLMSLTSFNDEARTAGKQAFARYTFVNDSTDYSAKADSYDMRLQAIATALSITIDGELVRYASSVEDYNVGTQRVCFIGDPLEVADVSASQSDSLMGDMYSVWAWRYKSTKWTYGEDEDGGDESLGSDWTNWNSASNSVLIMATNTDSGDEPIAAVVPPCR